MKTIQVIGDIHGRDSWKKYTEDIENYDKIIFLGDYVDSFTLTDIKIIDNLNEIIELKKKYLNKIELLLGNHDLMYYFMPLNNLWMSSGYRPSYALEINRILNKNKLLFKASYQINNWLFTHAGLSRLFLKSLQKRLKDKLILVNNNYSEYLNEVFSNVPNYLSDISQYRGGNSKWGGIFWADIKEFSYVNYIPNLNMIMGHHPVLCKKEKVFKDGTTLIWIDTESVPHIVEESSYILTINEED